MIIKTSTKITRNKKRVETDRQYYECDDYKLIQLKGGGIELRLDNEDKDVIILYPGDLNKEEVKSLHIYPIDVPKVRGYYIPPKDHEKGMIEVEYINENLNYFKTDL